MHSFLPTFEFRSYQSNDEQQVLALFDLLSPQYFAQEERVDLAYYLAKERELYFVVYQNNTLVAAGGINFQDQQQTGIISWDLVAPHLHGKGIGSALLQHRITVLRALPAVTKILVRTSQHAYLFYEKHGFKLTEIQPNFWAPTFDLYAMTYSF